MPKVSLVKGNDRRGNVMRSLDLIFHEIKKGLGSRQVIIKPNFVSTSIQLASSHVDQIRGILDFFKSFYTGKIIIAEAACGDTIEAYKNFGYLSLAEEYNVELTDLNKDSFKELPIRDWKNKTIYIKVSSMLLDKNNYLVSAAKLKTHDRVVVTLSIKNMAVGSILHPYKKLVHQGIRQTNMNIAEVAGYVWPDLSVIDGHVGMEGNGPINGDAIGVGIALTSTDPLAADRVACEIMGVDFYKVGYLHFCVQKGLGESDLMKIHILGQTISECKKPFKLHRTVVEQYAWKR